MLEKTTLNIANTQMISRQWDLLDVLASCLFEQILFHNGHIYKVNPQYVFFHVLSGDQFWKMTWSAVNKYKTDLVYFLFVIFHVFFKKVLSRK